MALVRQYLKFETPDGEISIEATDDEGAQVAPGMRRGRDFEAALGSVKAVANSFARMLAEVDVVPEAASLELALKFTAEAGAVFATIGSEAQMKLTLTWKGKPLGV